jgi:hypothetical protein
LAFYIISNNYFLNLFLVNNYNTLIMYFNINYRRLKNRTFVQFFQHLLEILQAGNPETLLVKKQYDDLLPLVAVLFELTQADKGSEISDELVELDGKRDATWWGIDLQIQSFAHHFDPAKQEAAIALENSLTPFGTGFTRLKYVEETNTLNGIINKWEGNADLSTAITTLALTEWVNKLKAENTLFDTKFKARVNERADAPDVKSVELRKQIIAAYRELLAHLQAHTTLSTDGSYDTINNRINQLIDEYNKMIPKKEQEETPAEEAAE